MGDGSLWKVEFHGILRQASLNRIRRQHVFPKGWFVMEELRRAGVAQGDWVVMLAYGAGISAHAYFLRNKAAVVPI